MADKHPEVQHGLSLIGHKPEILIGEEYAFEDPVHPKVTVITASFNLDRFVRDTLVSILRQDYPSFEVIVVDGGSTDGTLAILRQFPGVRVISERDDGYLDAFWKGLRAARGDYIMQCCVSDGYLSRNWIRQCVEAMEKDRTISLVWGFPQYLNEAAELGTVSFAQFHTASPPQKADWFYHWAKTWFHFPEGNLCVRRAVIEACMPAYRPGVALDVEPWLEFSYQFHRRGYLGYHLPTIANFGRTHSNQLGQRESQTGIFKRKAEAYYAACRAYRRELLAGATTHVFRDGDGNPLPVSLSRKALRRAKPPSSFARFRTRLLNKAVRVVQAMRPR